MPEGIDQRSACRHPDWTGPDDLVIKINELREITDWQVPIYVKIGATRVYNDVKLAVHAGADVVVVDGMQGGTAATQSVFIEHVGIPTLAALRQAVEALEEMDMRGKVQLIVSGGIRTGADVAKALALGADAVSIGQGMLIALGCNHEAYFQDGANHSADADYAKLGTAPGYCHHCHTGRCPVGITTQDAMLEQRLEPAVGAKRLKNYFKTMNMELTTVARACGKSNVHHLEREDLVALTIEAAAMAQGAARRDPVDPGRERILMPAEAPGFERSGPIASRLRPVRHGRDDHQRRSIRSTGSSASPSIPSRPSRSIPRSSCSASRARPSTCSRCSNRRGSS